MLQRNVSAEIFVVCTRFLAPQFIDPKFLDPKHVFKEASSLPPAPTTSDPGAPVTTLTPAATNVLQPGKKRRHRDGYADGDYTLFHAASASDFVRTHDPVTFLGTFGRIEFRSEEEKEWLANEVTTPEISANCEDLKVLGKGDFKALLKWRTALREEVRPRPRPRSVED
jgi:AdoMet-dependent rRNA methyltransferase SPB1